MCVRKKIIIELHSQHEHGALISHYMLQRNQEPRFLPASEDIVHKAL